MKVKHILRSAATSLAAGLLALAAASPASASGYSAVVVYGDSLSDNGNFYAASGYTYPPSPLYYQGRRSNGPLAVEYMASQFGVPLVDLAWIGATTGVGNYGDGGTVTSNGLSSLPGMSSTFATTFAYRAPFLSDGLFVLWGGPNDALAPSSLDLLAPGVLNPPAVIERAVVNLLTMVAALQGEGVQNILVPGMPDLGLTPTYMSQGPVAAAQASAFTDAFNAMLLAALPAGVMYYDTAGFLRDVEADPQAYGLTNASDPCFNSDYYLSLPPKNEPFVVCSNPQDYLFFDSFHPSTVANGLLAGEFIERVPEPASISLIGLSLCLMGGAMRRRQRAG